jgi:hypothetical protein
MEGHPLPGLGNDVSSYKTAGTGYQHLPCHNFSSYLFCCMVFTLSISFIKPSKKLTVVEQ